MSDADVSTPVHGGPVLRIVRGTPTEAELAALVAVVAAASGGGGAVGVPAGRTDPRSLWRSRSRNIRPPLSHGPGAWRASGLPR